MIMGDRWARRPSCRWQGVCLHFFANRSLSARGDKGPAAPSKDENRNALGTPPNLSSSPK
jgi:hypothetical protein